MVDVGSTESDEFIGGEVVGHCDHKETRGRRARIL